MADLDQAARYALKLDPEASLNWLVPECDRDLAFLRWADTQTIAFPGEPSRRCDTVAELRSRSGIYPPWLFVVEVQAGKPRDIDARALEYAARLMRKLRHGPGRRDRYLVAAAVILLSSTKENISIAAALPGTDLGLKWTLRTRSLGRERAATTLERIAHGEFGRSVLPWVPLMVGGGEVEVAREWVRLARQEPDQQRRGDYGALALVFAGWANRGPAWREALEGWNVAQSKIVAGWKEEGRQTGLAEGRALGKAEGFVTGQVEAQRALLLTFLARRFAAEVSTDLTQWIAQQTDQELLSRWCIAAVEAPSYAGFCAAVQFPPPPARGGNGTAAG